MFKQPFCSFSLSGVNLTDYGLKIPSPFCSLTLTNAQITSFTSWELRVTVVGDDRKGSNIAAFEALIYSASQDVSNYASAIRVPVSFMFGWTKSDGTIGEYLSYQGYFINYAVSTSGLSMTYTLTGYCSIGYQSALPVYNFPAVCGVVQPSAILEALYYALKMDTYYTLDIDHNDAPTLVNHGAMTTSVNSYVRGNYSAEDDYANFPGLLKLSKSYSNTRDAAGLKRGYRNLNSILNNASVTPVGDFLQKSIVDYTPQCSTFSYWVDEPTMTQLGIIHYKSNAGLLSTTQHFGGTLEYGTANTNILSLSGSFSGIAYNMTNMDYSSVGFAVDGSGNTIVEADKIVNSWSASLADVYQTVNIINDVNALSSQFSEEFSVEIPGNIKEFTIAQPVSLIVMAGNSISPITGIYNIISVSHKISSTFTTTLKIQRLQMSAANEVATSQNITLANGVSSSSAYTTTSNIKSFSKVDFGTLYPTYEDTMVG